MTVGGDYGGMRLGMVGGRTYRFTGWIFVPAATGLLPSHVRGLRIVAWYRVAGVWYPFESAMPAYTDAWQELSVDMSVPTTATDAFIRLYNGNVVGSGKSIYWDHLSLTEIVAPFGPSWTGGALGGYADAPYTTLTFPTPKIGTAEPSVARVGLVGGGAISFSKNTDNATYSPQPGAEGLALSKPDANTYRITDLDGSTADFTLQGGAWALTATLTPEQNSKTRLQYSVSGSRALPWRVISPVEPGVDDALGCTVTLVEGCEVLEYVYASATTAGLSQTVFGDYVDHVKQVKVYAWDPAASAVTGVVVAEYRYDIDGELRQVWDPRVSGPNLALSHTATGSTSCNANEGPEKAVNGSVAGGTSDKFCTTSAPRWWQVDLGSVQIIASVVVRHAAAGGESSAWNTRDFSVQVSTDASTWTTVATVTANTDAVTAHPFTPTSARYVKLNITTPTSDGNGAARIYEVEVYPGPPPLVTSYDYASGGRVSQVQAPGELGWTFEHTQPDVDDALLRWNLDEGSGTTAADSSGNNRTGTLSGTSGWGRGQANTQPVDKALALPMATNAAVTTTGGFLATNASFTVAAWVNATESAGNWRDAVAQDGATAFGFQLGYDASVGRWGFAMALTDTVNPSVHRAQSTTVPVKGTWTHLAGVYDHSAGQIRIYVNGVLHATTSHTSTWNATGTFAVGRAKWNGASVNWWSGGIDDVRTYQKVLSADQIATLAGDENPGRLIRVSRTALLQGSPTATDGTIATTVVYHVPLTTAAGGPHTLDATSAATWGQADLPTDATALFGPEDTPARSSATPTSPGSSGYPYASVHYLNANGQQVNTATPGGHIDTAEYDRFGNVVRSLQATAREIALGSHPQSTSILAELGLAGSATAVAADALSSKTTYSTDGIDVLDTVGPTVTTVLEAGLADPDGSGPLAGLAAGATVVGRGHTVNAYDQNKPDGTVYHLLTTTTSGLAIPGYPDAGTRTTTYAYDAAQGGTSGWVLRKPTTVVADAGAGGMQLTTQVIYDAQGRATQSRGVGATGSDARTTATIYYTAGTNSADAACGNTKKWAGQPCVTTKAGAVTGHDPSRMATNLPERRITAYTRWGDPETVTETVAGTSATRSTITTYDGSGRIATVAVTNSGDGATALPTITAAYDPATGQVITTGNGSATITREYDRYGRVWRYTDADGGGTTNEYDRYGKPTKATDPTGYATFAYDRTAEPRGFVTTVTDSIAGAFGAQYSPDGQLTVLHYPNGTTRTDALDANLNPVQRTYTRDSDSAIIYRDAVVNNSHGQVVTHTYDGGSRTYTYDHIGRLATVAEQVDGTGCTTRSYSHDTRSNRQGRTTYNPDVDGSCMWSGTPAAQTSHSVDSADRLVDTGYTYDPFGRITTAPGGLTNTFYANDLIAAQVLGDARQDWTLDPQHRARGFTTASYDGSSWTTTASRLNHYSDDTDSPRWIVEDTTTGALTRLVAGPDATLAATTSATGEARFTLVNLHGDIITTTDTAAMPASLNRFDEFGVPSAGQNPTRYGWLGGNQRSAEAIGGTILMGVRLYHPDTGRFLQPDPVDGGSATAYDYCYADPINCTDLDGRWGWKSIVNVVATVTSVAAIIPGPIGMAAAAVSAVSYAAVGNREQALIMTAGIALAAVGAGAAVVAIRAARSATTIGRAVTTVAKFAGKAGAVADRLEAAVKSGVAAAGRSLSAGARGVAKGVSTAGRTVKTALQRAGRFLANGNNLLRIGRSTPGGPFRVSIGPAPKYFDGLSTLGKIVSPIHIHIEARKIGVDFNWLRRSFYKNW